MHKLKNTQILSNGVTTFFYKTYKNVKSYSFFEKDHKNFYLNVKKITLSSNDKVSSTYKNKYF